MSASFFVGCNGLNVEQPPPDPVTDQTPAQEPEGTSDPSPTGSVSSSAHVGPDTPERAVDGQLGTWWTAGVGEWIQVDLQESYPVNAVQLAWRNGDSLKAKFDVLLSVDGDKFQTAFSGSSTGTTTELERYDFTATPARYVRVLVHGTDEGAQASLSELEVETKLATPPQQPAPSEPTVQQPPPAPATEGQTVRIAAVGDIAKSGGNQMAVGNLIRSQTFDAVLTLGDQAYNEGTESQFRNYYEPAFGSFKDKTFPSLGNHEYGDDAKGYFAYYGDRACPTDAAACSPSKGYYSFDVGEWHMIALNSNCSKAGGCDAGSAQEQWLRADLAANKKKCVLAFMHHPRWSSGAHGDTDRLEPLVQALYDSKVELLLAGHDHHYERFAPLSPSGQKDEARGITQFVVGTGGVSFRSVDKASNSVAAQTSAHGVLDLTLRPDGYDYAFLPVAGKSYSDQGSVACQ